MVSIDIYLDNFMYFFCGLISAVLGILLMIRKRNIFNVGIGVLLETSSFAVIGGIIGSRILNAIFKIIEDFCETNILPPLLSLRMWKEWLGRGSCFYGALLGATVAVIIFGKIQHTDATHILGVMTYFLMPFCSLGRLGCWFAGCCYGRIMSGGWQFPSQFAEAGYCALIFLFFIIKKFEHRKPGIIFPMYVLLYSLGRVFFEFFREGTTRVGFMSMSQWVAVALVIVNLLWIIKILNEKTQGTVLCVNG